MTTTSVEDLVNRAVLRWEAEARALHERGSELIQASQKPMIAISRDFGALGKTLGDLVGERLRFHVYDKELVQYIAETAKARTALIESVDERLQHGISDWIARQFGRGNLANSDYLHGLCEVVLALGQKGKGIIVGRGAQFILDPQRTLRVRVLASFELRVRRIMERRGLGDLAAREETKRVDEERREFVRHHFKQDPADPEHYDLVVNTDTLPVPVCADLVTSVFRARFGG